ncbi:hypothetical protein [Chromobacterium phragmitis]|uniref:Uncharacterized protein n=1 Tax=Chromobacterium phragmitis TaxID=2202141 RepID=A0ABV0IN66_9NEIS
MLLTDMVLLLENEVAGQRYTDPLLSLAAAGWSEAPARPAIIAALLSLPAVVADGNVGFYDFP